MLLVVSENLGKHVFCPRTKEVAILDMSHESSCGHCGYYRCITYRDIQLCHPEIMPTHETRECVDCGWEGSR